jgi:hypothetical protein
VLGPEKPGVPGEFVACIGGQAAARSGGDVRDDPGGWLVKLGVQRRAELGGKRVGVVLRGDHVH